MKIHPSTKITQAIRCARWAGCRNYPRKCLACCWGIDKPDYYEGHRSLTLEEEENAYNQTVKLPDGKK